MPTRNSFRRVVVSHSSHIDTPHNTSSKYNRANAAVVGTASQPNAIVGGLNIPTGINLPSEFQRGRNSALLVIVLCRAIRMKIRLYSDCSGDIGVTRFDVRETMKRTESRRAILGR